MEEYRHSKTRSTSLTDERGDDFAVPTWSADSDTRKQRLVPDLIDLVLHPQHNDITAARMLAARAGVTAEDMADHYIPAVARDLGEQWCTDQLGFAEVTIGTARLQAMLRDFGESWSADQGMNPNASTILLAVLDDVHHTLGAFVLSGQLRRKGLSVRLLLGATAKNINESCEMAQYDAIFISSSTGNSLETLRKTIDSVRKAQTTVPPVVIGGSLVETTADMIALTGTDYIANTADEAIALCNLRTKPRANATLDQ